MAIRSDALFGVFVCNGELIEVVRYTDSFKDPEYKIWYAMLVRCYQEKSLLKNKSYVGCSVSESFKDYRKFKKWCNKQIGFRSRDEKGRVFHLDKDILIKGNKVYSEDTCCFVPHEINSAITSTGVKENELPVGVSKRKDRDTYSATITKHGKVQHLGVVSYSE